MGKQPYGVDRHGNPVKPGVFRNKWQVAVFCAAALAVYGAIGWLIWRLL